MRARVLLVSFLAIVVVAFVPAPARAQSYFAPFFGYDFGGDAGLCPSLLTDCTEKKTSYGMAFGHLGGLFGAEGEIGYAPDFFGKSVSFGDNSVLTLMGNIVLALPSGPVRPYFTAGLGTMRTKVSLELSDLLSVNDSTFGYNMGGGVLIFLPHHLGIRGDYRNFRSASDVSIAGISIGGTKLSFSRVSVGLVLH
jgi:opacity protein-like surface antigen